jgi:hypothetical protein
MPLALFFFLRDQLPEIHLSIAIACSDAEEQCLPSVAYCGVECKMGFGEIRATQKLLWSACSARGTFPFLCDLTEMSRFRTVELLASAALGQTQEGSLLPRSVSKNSGGCPLRLVSLSTVGTCISDGYLTFLTRSSNVSNLLQENITKVAVHYWSSPSMLLFLHSLSGSPCRLRTLLLEKQLHPLPDGKVHSFHMARRWSLPAVVCT